MISLEKKKRKDACSDSYVMARIPCIIGVSLLLSDRHINEVGMILDSDRVRD